VQKVKSARYLSKASLLPVNELSLAEAVRTGRVSWRADPGLQRRHRGLDVRGHNPRQHNRKVDVVGWWSLNCMHVFTTLFGAGLGNWAALGATGLTSASSVMIKYKVRVEYSRQGYRRDRSTTIVGKQLG
jgi:hypothetical protein